MISICTPTYNRAYTLPRLFESLTKQQTHEFEWIVIDDGSKDNTKELIKEYESKAAFSIRYVYQENQGKHIALNLGQNLAKNELFFCLDSDDWLVENCLLTIMADYETHLKRNVNLAGMMYLDMYESGKIIGTSVPNFTEVNWIDMKYKHNLKGDKCYIFKTKILREFPFPTFNGNNHMPPTYQFYLISQKYNMFSINTPMKVVEYLEDGLSNKIKDKYFTAADNYAFYRRTINDLIPNKKFKLKNLLLYNISYKYSKHKKEVKLIKNRDKLLSVLLYPISLLVLIYYKKVNRSGNR